MWFIFALSSAIFDTFIDIFTTKNLKKGNFSPYIISWGINFFGGFFLIPVIWWLGLPKVDNNIFWFVLCLGGIINAIAYGNYYTSLQNADLSLIAPLTCLTPVFLLFISPLFLLISNYNITTELPSITGIIGVIFIFIGSYILNLDQSKKSYLEPVKYIWFNPDLKKAILAAFLWSITMSLSKVALTCIIGASIVQESIFWGCIYSFTVSIFLLPFVVKEINTGSNYPTKNDWLILISLGLTHAILMFCQMLSLNLIVTAYAIAVKRLSNIFKVILGSFLFNEPHFQERILASLIMLLGVVFLTITNLIPNFYPLFWQKTFY
jgi:drug/metabolite transporter (DMT)-like permease